MFLKRLPLVLLGSLLPLVACDKSSDTHPKPGQVPSQGTPGDQAAFPFFTMNYLSFVPKYKEWITFTMPLSSTGGAFGRKLNLTNISFSGGEYRNVVCTEEVCTIELFYSDYKVAPGLTFQMQSDNQLSPQYQFKAKEEVLSAQPGGLTELTSKRTVLSLTLNKDYKSSWNRPMADVVVESAEGFVKSPVFTCTVESCVASVELESKANYTRIHGTSIRWRSRDAQYSRMLSGYSIKYGATQVSLTEVHVPVEGMVVEWKRDVNYTVTDGATPSVMDFMYSSNVVASDASCDIEGTCRAKIKLRGRDEFGTIEYYFNSSAAGNVAHSLIVKPTLAVRKENFKVFKDLTSDYQTITIKEDALTGYSHVNGEKALAIEVEEVAAMEFENVAEVNDANRNEIFKCDDKGQCSARIKSNSSVMHLRFKVRTKSDLSASTSVHFSLSSDSFKKPVLDTLLAEKNANGLPTFTYELTPGNGPGQYQSTFPAQSVLIKTSENYIVRDGVVSDEGRVIDCDVNGRCVINGLIKNSDVPVFFDVTLRNNFGSTDVRAAYIIDPVYSKIIPAVGATFVPTEHEPSELRVVLGKDGANGYTGDGFAKRLVITKSHNVEILNGTQTAEKTLSIECDNEGKCPVRFISSYRYVDIEYYLETAAGERSVKTELNVPIPEFYVGSLKAKVAKGYNNEAFTVKVSSASATTLEIKVGDEWKVLDCLWGDCSGRLDLSEESLMALNTNGSLVFEARMSGRNTTSKLGKFTLVLGPSFTLKPNLVLEAKRTASNSEQYDLVIPRTAYLSLMPDTFKFEDSEANFNSSYAAAALTATRFTVDEDVLVKKIIIERNIASFRLTRTDSGIKSTKLKFAAVESLGFYFVGGEIEVKFVD